MPQPTKTGTEVTSTKDGTGRVTIQLDKECADKLDALTEYVGAEAGKSLGITVSVSRTDVVRALVTARHTELTKTNDGPES